MQRQPAPRSDPNRPDHFLSRKDALQLYGGNQEALTNLTDLPSANSESKKASETKKILDKRDTDVTKALKLRSWDPKKVKGIVACYHCSKPRCFFSQSKNDEYRVAAKTLHANLEIISFRYSCGDLVFEDRHPVSNVIGQRQSLTCESQIEKSYYNLDERSLKLPDICIYCGESGSNEFLLRQEELEERNKTGGRKCYPICILCLEAGNKVVMYPKKKTNQSRKRKETAANKTVEQATWKKRA